MEIKKTSYESLSAVPRAAAAFMAINRSDTVEVEKLFGNCPQSQGHGKAILGLGQAIEIYNRLAGECILRLLHQLHAFTEHLAFCDGWLTGGGAPEDARYMKRFKTLETLGKGAKQLAAELEAVKEAAREWADHNGVPQEIFSGPLVILNLGKKSEDTTEDKEMLIVMRALFQEILLNW
jgi:hypothetical protein